MPLVPLGDENHAQITSDFPNGTANGTDNTNGIENNAVSGNDENHAQNMATNGTNGTNDTFPTSTKDPSNKNTMVESEEDDQKTASPTSLTSPRIYRLWTGGD